MVAEWFVDLYDDFRRRTGFGAVPIEQTRREVDFLVEVLRLSPGSRVLDLFCGAGRHCIELAGRGCVTTGIELNADYVALAREAAKEMAQPPTFLQGDVRRVDYGHEHDAVIIMFQSFGYLSDEEDGRVLRGIFEALRSRGRFLIEVLNRDWILSHFVPVEDRVLEGIRVVERREFDPVTNRSQFTIERHEPAGLVSRRGSWRLYTAPDLVALAAEGGLRFVAGYADLGRAPLTADSRLMRLLFEKP